MRWERWSVAAGVSAVLVVMALIVPPAGADPICTTTWTGGAGDGLWTTSGNWSSGSTPSAEDRACLPAASSVAVTSGTAQAASVDGEGQLSIGGGSLSLGDADATSRAASITVTGGSMSVAGPTDVSDLTVDGAGVLSGAGTVSVSGVLDWTGGSMTGAGTTELTAAASGTIHVPSSGTLTLSGRTLRSAGTLVMSSGRLELSQGALLDNSGALTIDAEDGVSGLPYWAQPGVYDLYSGARARLRNTGVLEKAHGTGRTAIGPQVDNQGTIDALTGRLAFTGGGYGQQTGAWSASGSGSSLEFSGSTDGAFSLNEPSGTLAFAGATATAASLASATDSVSVSSGSLTLTDPDATSQAQSLTVDGGQLSTAGRFEVDDATLSASGEIAGTGTLVMSDTLDWTGGSMTGTGVTELTNTASGSIHGPTPGLLTLSARTLRNAGALTFSSGRLEADQGALIDNSGTLTVNAEDNVSGVPYYVQPGLYDRYFGARARLRNTGVLQKSRGCPLACRT